MLAVAFCLNPRSRIRASLTIVAILFALSTPLRAEVKLALVVGMSEYQHVSKLTNPRNDAEDMASAFRQLGFRVIVAVDAVRSDLMAKIAAFQEELSRAKIAVFFYAGHAIQINGQNYIIPVDAKLSDQETFEFETIGVSLIQSSMEQQKRTSLIFLDACRDNPFARSLATSKSTRSLSVQLGLARGATGLGTLISYSTQPGNVALDGVGRNSPYTSSLKKHIVTEGADLTSILINVRNDVIGATERRQIPWDAHSLTDHVYLSGSGLSAHDQKSGQQRTESRWQSAPSSGPPSNRCYSFNGKEICP